MSAIKQSDTLDVRDVLHKRLEWVSEVTASHRFYMGTKGQNFILDARTSEEYLPKQRIEHDVHLQWGESSTSATTVTALSVEARNLFVRLSFLSTETGTVVCDSRATPEEWRSLCNSFGVGEDDFVQFRATIHPHLLTGTSRVDVERIMKRPFVVTWRPPMHDHSPASRRDLFVPIQTHGGAVSTRTYHIEFVLVCAPTDGGEARVLMRAQSVPLACTDHSSVEV